MEDERTFNPVPDNINQGVVRYLRDAPPAHYSVKIQSFSKLVNAEDEKYESALFDASGFTWRLVIYPNGNTKRGGAGHISLYLAIEKTESLPRCWEAYVTYKMFVFDLNEDQYLTIQDEPEHQIRRFHRDKKESGFDRLISLDTFSAATNGYLIDDSCVFGVEVYEVVKNTGNGETIKMIDDPLQVTFNWKICDYSTICREKLHSEVLESEEFTAGKNKWRLQLYPNGDSGTKDHLSLFLKLVETPASGKKVSAKFSVMIKNQKSDCHHKRTAKESWFSTSTTELITDCVWEAWGWPNFMLLRDLTRESGGFIVNDRILIQAKVRIKTEVISFS